MEKYNIEEKFIDNDKLIFENVKIRNDKIVPKDRNKTKYNKSDKKVSIHDQKNKKIFLLNYYDPKKGKYEHVFVEKNK